MTIVSKTEGKEQKGEDSGSPPILRSWTRIYLFVLGELLLLIVLFYAFSRFYQ